MREPEKLLYTSPDCDTITSYLDAWCEKVSELAEERGWRVYSLTGEDVDKENFDSRLDSNDPDLVYLNGHGVKDKLFGYSEPPEDPEPTSEYTEIILIKNENEDKLNNRIVCTNACFTLPELGESCVNKGAKAYIGYDGYLFLPNNRHMVSNPRNDKFAKPVMEVLSLIPKLLIKGKTVEEALERTYERFEKKVDELETKNDPRYSQVVDALIFNMRFLGYRGDGEASV